MDCPFCGAGDQHKVVESRPKQSHVHRRRQCLVCKHRFSTRETVSDISEAVAFKRGHRAASKSFGVLAEKIAHLWDDNKTTQAMILRLARELGVDESRIYHSQSQPTAKNKPKP